MSDAALAAVAGLLGVGLSGGVQVGLELRRDHKNRRAALRPVENEIVRLIAMLTIARDHPGTVGALSQPEEWHTHEESLSRELSDRKWSKLVAAYGMYDLVLRVCSRPEVLESEEARDGLMQTMGGALRLMNEAHRSLSLIRWWSARRTNETIARSFGDSRFAQLAAEAWRVDPRESPERALTEDQENER